MQRVEPKQLIGGMNWDDPFETIGKGYHYTAWNGIFRGPVGNRRFEGIAGTNLVTNADLPNIGTNMTIGVKYDPVNKRVFFFNYNTAGSHGIYIYYTLLKTFQTLIKVGVNTDGDILGFSGPVRIDSIDILYGDGGSGDLLFYVDSLKRPRKLNINRILAGGYTPIKNNYLKVIKAPPVIPPQCVYENDTTVTANNLLNSLFKFSYTFIYDDFEESVLSSGCAMALPSDPFDPANNASQTRNCRIRLYLQTGDKNVSKIRIYGKQTKSGSTSDWFVVDTLIKADLGIVDNGVCQYLFLNTGNYVSADPKFTVLLEDFVPQQANCQALLNGTTIAYAGITEGYPYLNPSFNITSTIGLVPLYGANGTLFYASYNGVTSIAGTPQIELFLTGVGTNDGFGNPAVLEKSPREVFIRAKSNGTDISFNYTNPSLSGNILVFLAGLAAAAVTAGWVVVTTNLNSLVVYYPTGTVTLEGSYLQNLEVNNSPFISPVLAFYYEAAYQWAIVEYDEDGRTNGALSNVTGQSKTPVYNNAINQIPEFDIDLSGFTPSPWARYYHLLRTDNLTYNKRVTWISNQAFSNIGQTATTRFAYFSITNMFDYNTDIKATQGVVSYDFSEGDRIRILGRYAVDGVLTTFNFDYSVLGVSVNPIINGITQIGRFVQIAYPFGDISGSYNFDGGDDFQNYSFILYSYKSFAPTNQNVFFEIGQEYGIGNPGTNSAYFIGNIRDNLIKLTDGDIFYRPRTIPIGNTYYLTGGPEGDAFKYFNTRLTPASPTDPTHNTIVASQYTIGTQLSGVSANVTNPAAYPVFTSADWLVNNTGSEALTVRVRATVPVTVSAATNFAAFAKILGPGAQIQTQTILAKSTGLIPNTSYTIDIDGTIIVPVGWKLFILYSNTLPAGNLFVTNYTFRLDIVKTQTIEIFEPSYSDIYNIVTNSDNRPDVVDTTARQTNFNTLFRFSQPYQLGTNINNSNRFYPNNFDEWDKAFDSVIRMRVRQRELIVFQGRRCGHTGIYAKYIKDNGGNTSLVTTDAIITQNNIEYYIGEYGIGNQGSSLASSGNNDYFVDPVKGYICRLALDGVRPISEEFKMQTFAGANLPNYLNTYYYPFGGNASILGVFNFAKDRDGEAVFVLQGGVTTSVNYVGPSGGTIIRPAMFIPPGQPASLSGRSISFDENKNTFSSFYNFVPDSIVCAENLLISFYNGEMYTHDNTDAYANFYGQQYFPSINPVFNDQIAIKKTMDVLSYQGNQFWESPVNGDILTSQPNQQTGLSQISALITQDYKIDEGLYYAALLRDANSGVNPALALLEGDILKGTWISCNLTYRGTAFSWIYLPTLKWSPSPKNF